jgi:hypothetical protein
MHVAVKRRSANVYDRVDGFDRPWGRPHAIGRREEECKPQLSEDHFYTHG